MRFAASHPLAKRAESEALRAEFRALDHKVKELIKRDPEEAYKLTCRLSVIIDSEMGGDLWLHSRALNDAFNAALVSRNASLASSTMQKAIKAWLRAGGDSDQELLKEMQGYAAPWLPSFRVIVASEDACTCQTGVYVSMHVHKQKHVRRSLSH